MKASFLYVLLGTLLIASCTTSTTGGTSRSVDERLVEMGLVRGEENSRIPRYRINGWNRIDQLNLVITAGVNDKYLTRLFAPCLGLDSAFFIGFSTPMARLDRFDNIIVRSIERGREVCKIQDIIKLEKVA